MLCGGSRCSGKCWIHLIWDACREVGEELHWGQSRLQHEFPCTACELQAGFCILGTEKSSLRGPIKSGVLCMPTAKLDLKLLQVFVS